MTNLRLSSRHRPGTLASQLWRRPLSFFASRFYAPWVALAVLFGFALFQFAALSLFAPDGAKLSSSGPGHADDAFMFYSRYYERRSALASRLFSRLENAASTLYDVATCEPQAWADKAKSFRVQFRRGSHSLPDGAAIRLAKPRFLTCQDIAPLLNTSYGPGVLVPANATSAIGGSSRLELVGGGYFRDVYIWRWTTAALSRRSRDEKDNDEEEKVFVIKVPKPLANACPLLGLRSAGTDAEDSTAAAAEWRRAASRVGPRCVRAIERHLVEAVVLERLGSSSGISKSGSAIIRKGGHAAQYRAIQGGVSSGRAGTNPGGGTRQLLVGLRGRCGAVLAAEWLPWTLEDAITGRLGAFGGLQPPEVAGGAGGGDGGGAIAGPAALPPLPGEAVAGWCRDAAASLALLHGAGVSHSDVRADQFLLRPEAKSPVDPPSQPSYSGPRFSVALNDLNRCRVRHLVLAGVYNIKVPPPDFLFIPMKKNELPQETRSQNLLAHSGDGPTRLLGHILPEGYAISGSSCCCRCRGKPQRRQHVVSVHGGRCQRKMAGSGGAPGRATGEGGNG